MCDHSFLSSARIKGSRPAIRPLQANVREARGRIKDGARLDVGDRITAGKDPVRFFEMNLRRMGDTDWPAAGAVSPA
jgi:hypothetical protein